MSKRLAAVVGFYLCCSPAAAQPFAEGIKKLDPPSPRELPLRPVIPTGGANTGITRPDEPQTPPVSGLNPDALVSRQALPGTLKVMLLLTVLSLAPAILMMTTCFVRFVIVFGLLRQALGTQQLPPNQVLVSLSLFLTFMVMAPIWQQAYEQGIKPYQDGEGWAKEDPSPERLFKETTAPLRRFMWTQIDATGNTDAIHLFLDYQRPPKDSPEFASWKEPKDYKDIPFSALLPAFLISELKTAFLIGFQIYLPFLVIDLVVSSVLISMGMMMLPPVLVSIPIKLLLFVLIDGWFLTVGMVLESVAPL